MIDTSVRNPGSTYVVLMPIFMNTLIGHTLSQLTTIANGIKRLCK